MIRAIAVCAALALAGAAISGNEVTPVQKVIQLLTDMKSKAQKMKQDEEVGFSTFKQKCTDEQASKASEIAKSEMTMESLSTDIDSLESSISTLSDAIAGLNQKVTDDDAALKAASGQRDTDNDVNTAMIADLSESVDALERAIAVLKAKMADKKQADAALLQLTSSDAFPDQVKRTVTAFVQMRSGMLDGEPGVANAYEFQSGGVVAMLEKLYDDFLSKKTEAEKAEMNSRHAYEMINQDLTDSIAAAKAEISKKTDTMQGQKETKAKKKLDLELETKSHADDSSYLSALKVECSEKSKSFTEKQNLRADEIAAIAKAVEILKASSVSGSAEKYLPTLVQNAKKSLAQLRASSSREEPEDLRRSAATVLSRAGIRLHSQQLSMIAERLTTSAGPFDKVKKMIQDLVRKLETEASEESEHKGYCDKELKLNTITRTKYSETIDDLTAKIDETTAFKISTADRIKELSKELSELSTNMADTTKARNEENAKNTETIADAKEAQKAVEQAIAVLKDFYKKASTATGLIQVSQPAYGIKEDVKMGSEEWKSLADPSAGPVDTGHKAGMQTFGARYAGMTAEAGGVFAMLEVILSDFATLEAETNSAEAEAAAAYKDFVVQSEKSQAVKEKEVELLTRDQAEAEAELASAKKDLFAAEDQLLAAERTFAGLKKNCIDTGVTYGERARMRQEEIESLEEALKILSGEAI